MWGLHVNGNGKDRICERPRSWAVRLGRVALADTGLPQFPSQDFASLSFHPWVPKEKSLLEGRLFQNAGPQWIKIPISYPEGSIFLIVIELCLIE